MSTEEVKKALLDGHTGPYAFLFSFIAAIMVLAQLGQAQIDTLEKIWPFLSAPAGLMLLMTPALWSIKLIFGGAVSGAFRAYIEEQRTRTKIEAGIDDKLGDLARQFQQNISNQNSFAARFDRIESMVLTTYKAIEKRQGEISHVDTEKFTAPRE